MRKSVPIVKVSPEKEGFSARTPLQTCYAIVRIHVNAILLVGTDEPFDTYDFWLLEKFYFELKINFLVLFGQKFSYFFI